MKFEDLMLLCSGLIIILIGVSSFFVIDLITSYNTLAGEYDILFNKNIGLNVDNTLLESENFYMVDSYNGLIDYYSPKLQTYREELGICKHLFSDEMSNVTFGDVLRTGFYRHSSNVGFYCVLTFGRTPEEVTNTDVHEKCHYLVREDYFHFCEEYFE